VTAAIPDELEPSKTRVELKEPLFRVSGETNQRRPDSGKRKDPASPNRSRVPANRPRSCRRLPLGARSADEVRKQAEKIFHNPWCCLLTLSMNIIGQRKEADEL
jgi:hypothetical protein